MSRARIAAALAACGVLVVAATACVQEADESPLDEGATGTTEATEDTDDGTGTGTGEIDWQPCGSDVECGELEVPVDYDEPDGDTLRLTITRVPAEGERVGALFVNPGGPGGTASTFAIERAAFLPDEVTERFDVIGVDPRGLGASELDCGVDPIELYGLDYTLDSDEDEDVLLDVSQEYVDSCEAAAGDLLPHLGTADVARDMDAVREALGDEQINYLGYSYGTAIGQVYAELFPERVRAMVIDGVVELGPTGVESAVDQAVGFENAFAAFVEDCDADDTCPIGPDAEAAVDDLTAAVEQEPIPATPRDLGPAEMQVGLGSALYSEAGWPDLADAVADALDGNGSGMVALADDYIAASDFDLYFAVNCLDFAWPDTAEELLEAGVAADEEAPHFGSAIVNDYVRCPLWPAEQEPLTEVTAPGTPTILVVGTTNDPATPFAAAERVAETLDDAVLLTYEGEGHGIVGSGVACIDDAVTTYLLDVEPPDEGTIC